MICENCGAQLSLDKKFCPYCGSVNKAARRHIADMEKYENKFQNTRGQVIKNSKWFSKYMALIISVTILVIVNAILVIGTQSSSIYGLRTAIEKQNRNRHGKEIQEKLNQYMEDGKYLEALYAYKYNDQVIDDDYGKWSTFYTATYQQELILEEILYYCDVCTDNSYEKESAIAGLPRNLKEFYDAVYQRNWNREIPEDVQPYVDELERQVKYLLCTYFNLSEQEVEAISQAEITEIMVILNSGINRG